MKLGTKISDWSPVNGRVHQGTILGPLLFLIMVNNLTINHDHRWKYVDDTSLSETIDKGCKGNFLSLVDEIGQWCTDNDMQLNHSKCKELIISFAKNKPQLHPLLLQDYSMVPVLSTKIWGIHLSSDLRWNLHIEHTVTKASKRLYFLRVLIFFFSKYFIFSLVRGLIRVPSSKFILHACGQYSNMVVKFGITTRQTI